MPKVRKPLVVAAPRSGFSLLISVINTLLQHGDGRITRSPGQIVLDRVVELASFYTTHKYRATFSRFGITRDLIFNGEFHLLIGGPKWLEKTNPQLAGFRKYFGVRGMGDFLLVTSHPRQVLEYNDVVHSHTAPGLWLKEDYYASFLKFTSIRNPIGIVNSASFSLNAMASEYIQNFLTGESEDYIRQRHGLYKLTDLEFFRGLVRFLKNYLDEYLSCQGEYFVMRWEELINDPAGTICRIASELDVACTEEEALALWKPMDHVNLLHYHKHNYRKGKGIVGDWKNSLVNEHLDIFREYGFDHYLERLGYPPVPVLDPRDYSPYQKLIARYLQRGEIYRQIGDPDLFGFAFNKSNIDASKFGFKSFPARKWTRVERSTLSRDSIVEAVSDTAEECCEKINQLLSQLLDARLETWSDAMDCIRSMEKDWTNLMGEVPDGRGVALYYRAMESLGSNCA
jgi:hypothetical protein